MKETKLKTSSGFSLSISSKVESSESKIIAIDFGADHSGKSTFGASGPELVAYIPLDRKTRYSAKKKAQELGRPLLIPDDDFVDEHNKGARARWRSTEKALSESELAKANEETKQTYRALVNKIKEVTLACHDHPDVQLIQIDLFKYLWVYMCYAHYGRTGHLIKKVTGGKMYKDTSQAADELRDFVTSLTSKHLILTHPAKAEYLKNNPTGKDTWDGYKLLGHDANVVIEHLRNGKYDPDSSKDEKSWHYGLNVVKCLQNPELEIDTGDVPLLTDDMISFPMLASMVFPEIDPEEFGG